MMFTRLRDSIFLLLIASSNTSLAGPMYNRDVRPILSDNCFACHGADAKHREAELRLDTQEGAHGKSKKGDIAIVPGNPAASAVWQRINTNDQDDIMPPPDSHKTLTSAQKETIRHWIENGAQYETHWAFLPPVRSKLPASVGNPVDYFVAKRLTEAGLSLSPSTDRETLLRRLSLDLTGLPPTLEELDTFLVDQNPGSYERQVERLLASPRYGEHMASAWLDLARYSDSNGYLHDIMRTAWPWRDWVIDAYNRDMPFDQFTIEQLAGDLLPDAKPNQILATSFLRNHPITAEGGTIAAEYLNEYSADRTETVGTVFLGLTFNCCRCHDHKFDPMPQSDYYSMQAYFNSSTEMHVENNESPAYPPLIEIASPLQLSGPAAKVMIMDEAKDPRPTFVLDRGQYDQPDEKRPVTRQPPTVLRAPVKADHEDRLSLARWLVSEKNPLLSRVTVNRLWQQIFATGLVDSVDDFGVQGEYPSHPELLDYLAIEFRETWSTKALLRLIVTSETYRQSSQSRPDLTVADPKNRLLGHFPRKRLSAEQIRDSSLLISGLLVEILGGPPVKPYQPDGLWREKANDPNRPTGTYVRGHGDDLYRRSIYTFHKRNSPPPSMSTFDAPERTSCSVRRNPTNTPLQALATMNDEQHLESAKALAMRTLKTTGNTDDRLSSLFRSVTGHRPSLEDIVTLGDGLKEIRLRFENVPEDAAALLDQGDFPGNRQRLLASVVIPKGSKADGDGYAFVPIPPVTLKANARYLIGGEDSNAFWDADIFGKAGNAIAVNSAISLIESRYDHGFVEPIKAGGKHAGRWASGNAKFVDGQGQESSLFDFQPESLENPQDLRQPNGYIIGNLFKVGDRDIEITALGLQDADGGEFEAGQVGLWTIAPLADDTNKAELAAWMLIASTVLNLDETLVRD